MEEGKKYNFINGLPDNAKKFANLALCKLKEQNINTSDDAKNLPPHNKFGHRKLPDNWRDYTTPIQTVSTTEGTTEVIRKIYKSIDDKINFPLSTAERNLSQLVDGITRGDFSFYFTFSESFGVIFCSVVSDGETGTTPYVLEEIKGGSVSAFAYYNNEYVKPADDAIYRVMGRVVTTDLVQEWTNKQAGSEEMFLKILPKCDWTRITVLRFFGKEELSVPTNPTDTLLMKR